MTTTLIPLSKLDHTYHRYYIFLIIRTSYNVLYFIIRVHIFGRKYKAYTLQQHCEIINIEPPYSIFMKPHTADCRVIAKSIHNAYTVLSD